MALADDINALSIQVNNLQALILGTRDPGLFYALTGSNVVYGSKITQGFSGSDMLLALDGAASGDGAHLNPDRSLTPVRPEQYSNISLVYGEVFLAEDKNVSVQQDTTLLVSTAPGTGYHRYDLVYCYVAASGSATAISAGTPVVNANTPVLPTAPAGTLSLAQVHVQANVTAIVDADITDLRNFAGRLQGSPPTINGTSASTVIVGTGNQSFTTQAGIAWQAGELLDAASAGTPTAVMTGSVVSYSGTSLVLNVTATTGSGSHSDWNLSITGLQGMTGNTGATGNAATISAGNTTTLAAGANAAVTNSGSNSAAVFNFNIPGSPTLAAGSVTTGAAGSNASVTNTGNAYAGVFNFTLPGSPTLSAGTTTTGAAGSNASVTNTGNSYAGVFNFTIPGSPTVAVGATVTGAPGSNASVTNTGNSYAATLNFSIPQGNWGNAATIAVGTVTTIAAGSNASVTNSGNSSVAVFDFNIPRGQDGNGSMTSVGLSLPSIFTVSNSPVTSSGTLSAVLAAQNSGMVFAGPSSGNAAVPTFRALVDADLTTNTALKTMNLSVFANTTSAQLAGVITGGTGNGPLVFGNNPTLVNPALGTPSSGTLTSCTGLPAAGVTNTAATLSDAQTFITNAKTFTNSLLKLLGSSTGATTFTSANAGASDYTVTFGAQNITLADITATTGGLVPTPPNNTTTFLRGDGTFAAPGGGGSLIYLSTVTASNSATVDIETTLDATYDEFWLIATGVTFQTGTGGWNCRLKVGGAYDTGSNYMYLTEKSFAGDTTRYAITSAATTSISLGDNDLSTAAGASSEICMVITNPASTTFRKQVRYDGLLYDNAGSVVAFCKGVAANAATTALTGVRFYAASGNIVAGDFRLYGIKKS